MCALHGISLALFSSSKPLSVPEFSEFLKHVYEHKTTELSVIDEIQRVSSNDLPNYVKAFYDIGVKSENPSLMTTLAQIINDACSLNHSNLFQHVLATIIDSSLGLLPECEKSLTELNLNSTILSASFIAELYNIGWIKYESMEHCINQISAAGLAKDLEISTLISILKIIGIKLARDSHGDFCKTYLQKIKNSNSNELYVHLMTNKAIKMLEDIHDLATIKTRKNMNIEFEF